MQREAFCDGLFELADLWTDSISEADYSEFLDLLFNRITKKVLDKKTGQYHYAWRELDEVKSIQNDPTVAAKFKMAVEDWDDEETDEDDDEGGVEEGANDGFRSLPSSRNPTSMAAFDEEDDEDSEPDSGDSANLRDRPDAMSMKLQPSAPAKVPVTSPGIWSPGESTNLETMVRRRAQEQSASIDARQSSPLAAARTRAEVKKVSVGGVMHEVDATAAQVMQTPKQVNSSNGRTVSPTPVAATPSEQGIWQNGITKSLQVQVDKRLTRQSGAESGVEQHGALLEPRTPDGPQKVGGVSRPQGRASAARGRSSATATTATSSSASLLSSSASRRSSPGVIDDAHSGTEGATTSHLSPVLTSQTTDTKNELASFDLGGTQPPAEDKPQRFALRNGPSHGHGHADGQQHPNQQHPNQHSQQLRLQQPQGHQAHRRPLLKMQPEGQRGRGGSKLASKGKRAKRQQQPDSAQSANAGQGEARAQPPASSTSPVETGHSATEWHVSLPEVPAPPERVPKERMKSQRNAFRSRGSLIGRHPSAKGPVTPVPGPDSSGMLPVVPSGKARTEASERRQRQSARTATGSAGAKSLEAKEDERRRPARATVFDRPREKLAGLPRVSMSKAPSLLMRAMKKQRHWHGGVRREQSSLFSSPVRMRHLARRLPCVEVL